MEETGIKCTFVFIPDIFSMNTFNSLKIKKKKNYIFPDINFFESAHDSACQIFAQLFGGLVDYGKHHSKKNKHPRYGKKLYKSSTEWSKEKPIIIICSGHGALIGYTLQYLLYKDFWGKCTDQYWVKAIISINGSFNGNALVENVMNITSTRNGIQFGFFSLGRIVILYFLYLYIMDKLNINKNKCLFNLDLLSILTFSNPLLAKSDCCLYELTYKGSKSIQKRKKKFKNTLYLNFAEPNKLNIFYLELSKPRIETIINMLTRIYLYFYTSINGSITKITRDYPYLSKIKFHKEYQNLTRNMRTNLRTGVYYYVDGKIDILPILDFAKKFIECTKMIKKKNYKMRKQILEHEKEQAFLELNKIRHEQIMSELKNLI